MLANTAGQLPHGPEVVAIVFVGLVLWLLPVIFGLRAARSKGRSPHWMWLGLHPLTGWVAFLWLRYGAQPIERQPPLSRDPDEPTPQDAPAASTPAPPQRVIVGTCEACKRPLRVKSSALSTEMRLTCKCGHLNLVRSYGQCSTCKRLVHADQAHLEVSYYDMEEYEDLYCPRCYRKGDPYRGRLLMKGGSKLRRSEGGA